MDGAHNCPARRIVHPVAERPEALLSLDPEPDPIGGRGRERHRAEAGNVVLADLGASTRSLDDADIQPIAGLSEPGEHVVAS